MKVLKLASPMMRGDMVALLQEMLSQLGYGIGKQDGIFGKQTETGVRQFQKNSGLTVDGKAGLKTFEKLFAKTKREPKTPHFKLSEFKCKDGTPVPAKDYGNVQEEMFLLEEVRHTCGDRPVTIQSGYRTESHNNKCGGAPLSQHLTASAADIKIEGMSPAEVYRLCDKLVGSRGGVGKYSGFTHVDTRGYRARW